MRKSSLIVCLIISIFLAINPVFAGRYYMPEIGRWATPDPELQKMLPNDLVKFQGGKLLTTSPYVYSYDNPLRYVDPDGNSPWDILDIASFGLSLKEFINKPTWSNAGWLLADAAGLLPIVPSTGLVRHGSQLLSKADLLKINFNAGKAAEQLVETGLKESGESFTKQVVRGSSRLDFVVTSSKNVIEVKNINWGAKTYQKSGGVTGRINKIRDQLLKYKDTLKECEQLILKITKPDDQKALKQLNQMIENVGAKIEWLE